MGKMMQDIRFALRQLKKTPGFTATAVLTLALGIGANAAIFTLVNAVLMKDLPVVDPQTLVRVGDKPDCCMNRGVRDDGDYSLFSTDQYQQFKKNNPEFEELAAMQAGFSFNPVVIRREGETAHSNVAEFVSGSYFRTFGLRPTAGRLLQDSDDAQGAPFTAVMSYELWERDYARDASVVGSTFWINAKPVTIVGIAPKAFYGDRLWNNPPNFYLPLQSAVQIENATYVSDPTATWLYIIGRVKPGAALPALQAKISTQLKQIYADSPVFSSAHDRQFLDRVHVVLTAAGAGVQIMQGGYKDNLQLLQWIAGLVLLIACANIANLLLVRGMARKMEMSLRTALGAARWRIVRQLLTESIVLALLGGIAALAVSYGGTELLLKLAFPSSDQVPIHASPSVLVMGFAMALSLITGVLFGVAPAWLSSHAQPADALRTGSRTTVGGASYLQRGLVVTQAALSLVLLVGAGMFAKSLTKLENIDMKLDATNRYIVHFDPHAAGYTPMQIQTGALYQTIQQRLLQIPGVVRVGLSDYTPMENNNSMNSVQIMGKQDLYKSASVVKATADYFDSVGTRLVAGRGLGVQDTPSSPTVAVVNQAFVKTFFAPGENPIGQRFGPPGPASTSDFTIVGVVQDTAYSDARWPNHEMYFFPLLQRSASRTARRPLETDGSLYAGGLVIQTAMPINNMEQMARQTLSSINPNLSIIKFQTFSDQIADQFTNERMLSKLMMLFGGLALLLACVGLYGVTSYGVVRRTSEIGIRMALGAERNSVVAMVLRGAMLQAMIGLAIGVPAAWYGVRFISSQLYDMKQINLPSLLIAVATLTVATCVAGFIPAQRAASIEPSTALRSE